MGLYKMKHFKPILAKLDDFLLEELMEVTHFDNMSTKQ
jgi:hypothetical protein